MTVASLRGLADVVRAADFLPLRPLLIVDVAVWSAIEAVAGLLVVIATDSGTKE